MLRQEKKLNFLQKKCLSKWGEKDTLRFVIKRIKLIMADIQKSVRGWIYFVILSGRMFFIASGQMLCIWRECVGILYQTQKRGRGLKKDCRVLQEEKTVVSGEKNSQNKGIKMAQFGQNLFQTLQAEDIVNACATDHVWNKVLSAVQAKGDAMLSKWLSDSEHSYEGSTVVLKVGARFVKDWIEQKGLDRELLSFFKDVDSSLEKIVVLVKSDMPVSDVRVEKEVPVRLDESSVMPNRDLSHDEIMHLNPQMTFENFVVGTSNEFAFSAAKRVAMDDTVSFNPLFLHSSVGLGKTHLLQAIANHIKQTQPHRSVLYLSAERFMYLFIQALRDHKIDSFHEIFRNVDTLLVDDIQFICGNKKATQDEFFHTFNELVLQGKQIILSADSAPMALKGIDERLQTRLAGGLSVDIHPTTYEMRLAIIQSKIALMKVNMPTDVQELLAAKMTASVRELEGALRRVVMNHQLLGSEISVSNTKALLKDIFLQCATPVSLDAIVKKVAEYYNISLEQLKSTCRDRRWARPRQIAMYLSKMLTTKSLPEIGRFFGRDHTTIMHAVKNIEKLKGESLDLCQQIDSISSAFERL